MAAAPDDIRGIYPIIYTAFFEDGRIDERGQRRIVDYLIDAGTHGLAACGGASETGKMTLDERKSLLELCAEQTNGRVPLIMGCTAGSTEESLDLVRHGASHGVRAAFGLLPTGQAQLKGDEQTEALRRHYLALGEASPIPIMVQEVSHPIPPETIVEIFQRCPNVSYVKEEAPDAGRRTTKLLELSENKLRILTGGANPVGEFERGAIGAIPGSIGVADLATAWNCYAAGDVDGAWRAWFHFLPLSHWRRQFGPLGAKEVLRRLGVIDQAFLRPPSDTTLDAHDLRELDEIMALQGPPY
jgi:4-hydroxy-tetrahydrodipicolinate synthase